MDILTIRISGYELLSILDFFDTHKPLPKVIEQINTSLRLQFASGIFNMKVDQLREELGYAPQVKIETAERQESTTTTTTTTTTKTETEEVVDPPEKRARSARGKRRAALNRAVKGGRRTIQSGAEDIWRPGEIYSEEGESDKGWEDTDNGEGGS